MFALSPRLIAYAIGACVIGVLVWRVNSWREDSQELSRVQLEMQAMQRQIEHARKASEGYQDEVAKLRAARKPAPVVRLCPPVPEARAASGPSGAAPAAGVLPQEPGRDVGADLYRLADEADELAARLRALQGLHK